MMRDDELAAVIAAATALVRAHEPRVTPPRAWRLAARIEPAEPTDVRVARGTRSRWNASGRLA